MKTLKIFTLITLLTLFFSCSREDENPDSNPQSPTLASVVPLEGAKNTDVTINGKNFGNNISSIEVYFNGKLAVVTEVTDTQIKTKVPVKASTGNIVVKKNGITLNGPVFTYIMSVEVSTFAGSSMGYADGQANGAQFNTPASVAIASDGTLYVADRTNHKIRKISPQGIVTTLAGSTSGFADGNGTNAKFNSPLGLTIGTDGNLYVADFGNDKIRKISPQGVVTTLAGSTHGFADGNGSSARFSYPFSICSSPDGTLYVADFGNHSIRKITLNGDVTTFAGNGISGDVNAVGAAAKFQGPSGVTYGTDGNVYVADNQNHKIKKIQPDGKVTTLAGSGILGSQNGVGGAAQFNFPHSIVMSPDGNLYVSDLYNHRIRKINLATTVAENYAGESQGFLDGFALQAKFNEPNGLAVSADGTLYLADFNNHKVRKIVQE